MRLEGCSLAGDLGVQDSMLLFLLLSWFAIRVTLLVEVSGTVRINNSARCSWSKSTTNTRNQGLGSVFMTDFYTSKYCSVFVTILLLGPTLSPSAFPRMLQLLLLTVDVYTYIYIYVCICTMINNMLDTAASLKATKQNTTNKHTHRQTDNHKQTCHCVNDEANN